MIVKTDKNQLYRNIITADSIITGKAVNSILTFCLFKVYRDEMLIISTDNEIVIKTRLECEADEEFSFAADGKKMAQILKEMGEGSIHLSVENNILNIKSPLIKGNYKVLIASADDFPENEPDRFESFITIDQQKLKTAIKKVLFSASYDTVKPVFNGVYIESEKNDQVNFVSSDSRRLSLKKEVIPESAVKGMLQGIIIPLKTITEVFRLLDNGECSFSSTSRQCYFKIGTTTVISRLVDGAFPDFRKVVPVNFEDTVICNTKGFSECIRRIMVFTREPTFKVMLRFLSDKVEISAKTPELGEAIEEVSIERKKSEEIIIGINGQYLMESLKEVETISFSMNITGSLSPLTIVPEDDNSFVSVIMPLQLKNTD